MNGSSRLERSSSNLCVRYVEFVGLPGVGKTTLRSEVCRSLVAAGTRCVVPRNGGYEIKGPGGDHKEYLSGWRERGWLRKSRIHASAHWQHPSLSMKAYRTVISGQMSKSSLHSVRSLLFCMRNIKLSLDAVRAGLGDIVLADQGIMSYAREILAASGKEPETGNLGLISSLFQAIDADRVNLVVLDLEVDENVRRIKDRRKALGPYDRMEATTLAGVYTLQSRWIGPMFTEATSSCRNVSGFKLDVHGNCVNELADTIVSRLHLLDGSKV